jgi:serine/threonine protein kinase
VDFLVLGQPMNAKSSSPLGGASAAQSTDPSALDRESQPGSVPVPLSHVTERELPVALGEIVAGKYQVLGVIGTGGMGHVVSALHVELGERVALKFLRREALANKELLARFQTEARAAAKIRSEHVARVFDVGTLANGIPYIVMEYLQGTDLAELLRREGRVTIPTAVGYVLQACEALASAHSAGIVHRDIKPDNLFLTRHPQGVDIVKVLDFGISKLALTADQAHEFVRTMFPLGSPSYMSPEQIRDSADVDSRTDIWSLGCVLFRLLTGAHAFDAPTLVQLGAVILEREPPPLRQFIASAPIELESIVRRCLEKNPANRWQNVAQLAQALAPFAPRMGRMAADRCSFLLPGAEVATGPLEHSERPSELPSVLVSSIRAPSPAPESLPELTGLRTRFGGKQVLVALGALAVVLLAYSFGRSSLGTQTTLAATEAVRSARGAVGPRAAVEQAEQVEVGPPGVTAGRAPAATERVATAATPVEPAPAPRLAAAAVAPPAGSPAPVAAKRAVAAAPVRTAPLAPKAAVYQPGNGARKAPVPSRKRYGRTRDEAFDVGY